MSSQIVFWKIGVENDVIAENFKNEAFEEKRF